MAKDRLVFTAVSEDASTEELAPIPFRLEGARRVPLLPEDFQERHGEDPTEELEALHADLRKWHTLNLEHRRHVAGRYGLITTWGEDFDALSFAPSGVLDDLMRSVGTDADGRTVYNAPSLMRFIAGILVDDEQVERFRVLARDRDRLVPIDVLGRVAQALAPMVTDTPT